MQLLVHLGLNKCASSYIQAALAAAQASLRRAGVFYPVEGGRPAQYGLSRYYGFGPEAEGLTPRSLEWLMREAERRGCARMILSSEYLSLARPRGVERFVADVRRLGLDARFLFFSRQAIAWVQSLFNQYVKTVDGSISFASINEFIDHVLNNRAVDIAGRFRLWADAVGPAAMTHHRIESGTPPALVLAPFTAFAGVPIPAPERPENRSLSPGALWLTALVRLAPRSRARDELISAIAQRRLEWVPVPRGYLEIDPARRARLEREVEAPRLALPHSALAAPRAA